MPADGTPTYFNEMLDAGQTRLAYRGLSGWLENMPAELRSLKQSEAEDLFRRIGITFAVYGEGGDPDRLIPFDMFPRIFSATTSGASWSAESSSAPAP